MELLDRADRALLRINEGPFDGACPPAGTPADYGASAESAVNTLVEPDLPPEGSRDVSFADPRRFTLGAEHHVQLCGIRGGTFTGDSTNTVAVTYAAPDLVVEGISHLNWHPEHEEFAYGPMTSARVRVANRGGSRSSRVELEARFNLPEGLVPDTSICAERAPFFVYPKEVPELDPGETDVTTLLIECRADEPPPLSSAVAVRLDPSNRVKETDEENNEAQVRMPLGTGDACGPECDTNLDNHWCSR
ncbi:MAG: hypothetical protein GWO05_20870 [Gammaproteobacteria bacterium]|nr:hypothetical protein [Gammaproteobacteria bacterium]